MSNRNTIQDELNSLNSGLDPDAGNIPYSVPEGYFEGLAAAVLAKISAGMPVPASEEIAQLSPLLAGISRTLPYSVPEDFFQSNIEGLGAFAGEEEESLVLSFISKSMPYQVPAGYFANLPEQVLEKVTGPGAKVIPLKKRKWMSLAVAAAVTGLMAISGIFYFNNRVRPASDPVVAVKKASTEELNEFIKNTTVVDDRAQMTVQNATPKTEAKKIFADISDKELNDFLDQLPADDVDIN